MRIRSQPAIHKSANLHQVSRKRSRFAEPSPLLERKTSAPWQQPDRNPRPAPWPFPDEAVGLPTKRESGIDADGAIRCRDGRSHGAGLSQRSAPRLEGKDLPGRNPHSRRGSSPGRSLLNNDEHRHPAPLFDRAAVPRWTAHRRGPCPETEGRQPRDRIGRPTPRKKGTSYAPSGSTGERTHTSWHGSSAVPPSAHLPMLPCSAHRRADRSTNRRYVERSGDSPSEQESRNPSTRTASATPMPTSWQWKVSPCRSSNDNSATPRFSQRAPTYLTSHRYSSSKPWANESGVRDDLRRIACPSAAGPCSSWKRNVTESGPLRRADQRSIGERHRRRRYLGRDDRRNVASTGSAARNKTSSQRKQLPMQLPWSLQTVRRLPRSRGAQTGKTFPIYAW